MTENEKKQIEEMENDLRYCHTEYSGDYGDIYTDYRKTAEKLVVIGYRKQSEGEWKHPPYAPFGGSYEMKRCSVCGYKPDFDSENPYTKFCPNCGAKMKGGAE